MMRLGICAALDARTTVHARSFLRGVFLSSVLFERVRLARHLYFNDRASADGGREAARTFIDAGVDAVIGHFASESAAAVVDRYAAAGIPLILPASTCAALTEDGSTAFRICASDRVLAAHLLTFAESQGLRRLALFADASLHGQRQRVELQQATGTSVRIVEDAAQADALVFCGRLHTSREFLLRQRAEGNDKPLLFTDDAASPTLVSGVQRIGTVFIISFPVAGDLPEAGHVDRLYQQIYGERAPVYALETMAAFSLVHSAGARPHSLLDALREQSFDTPAGAIRFASGENQRARVSLWVYDDNNAYERRLLC